MKWCDLIEEVKLTMIREFVSGVPAKELCERYGITNKDTTARKLRHHRSKWVEDSIELDDNFGDVVEAFVSYQDSLTKWKSQRVKNIVDIHLEETKPIAIAFHADRHLGSAGVDYKAQFEHAAVIARTEGFFSVEGGDAVENFIAIKDNSKSDLDIDSQLELYVRLLQQIKPLVICQGNHDSWTKKFAGVDIIAAIGQRVDILTTGSGGQINIHLPDVSYTIFRHHKYRYNSAFNLTHTVKRLYEHCPVQFDIGVVEHHHVPAIEPFFAHGEWRTAIRTGTYKTMDDYASTNGFYNSQVGVPIVFLWPNRRKIMAWPSMTEINLAAKFLGFIRDGH